MTYTFNRLLSNRGMRVKNPKGIRGTSLDMNKDRKAYVFSDAGAASGRVLGELLVMEFEVHAAGLFLRGYELQSGGLKAVYQEWFLGYEIRESDEKGDVK